MIKVKITVRGVDEETQREARADAVRQNKKWGDWVTEAMLEKLVRSFDDESYVPSKEAQIKFKLKNEPL